MSGTTPEIQKTPEIKTPEELIKRLEAKSQNTLADKVRAIETTVTGNAESKWKKLQAELPDAEKQQIEKILKGENPEVGTRLKVVAATAVATAGIATVVNQLDSSMEKTGLGKFGIKDSIKEWLTEELTDVPDKDADFFDKIMHKIKMMFLLPFAKMFGVDLTKKKEGDKGAKTPEAEKNGKKEESQKDSIEKVNENISFKLGYK